MSLLDNFYSLIMGAPAVEPEQPQAPMPIIDPAAEAAAARDAAAARMQQQVMPTGGRQEGPITAKIGVLGDIAEQMIKDVGKFGRQTIQAGPRALEAAYDYSQTGDYDPGPIWDAASLATTGGMPFAKPGAVGSAGGRLYATPAYDPKQLHPASIPTRLVTSKKATGAYDPTLVSDTPAMRLTPDVYEHNVNLVRDYPGIRSARSTGALANQFQDFMTDNLTWLHDQVPRDIRNRSALWYEGANKMAGEAAAKHDIPVQSAAGTYAALSPQKDWFQNVSLGDRLMDIYKNQASTRWTPEMTATAARIFGDPKYKGALDQVSGMRLEDLPTPEAKAMWIRTFDQAHNSPDYRLITPEGSYGDLVLTSKGVPAKVAWGSIPEIAKGVGAMESGGIAEVLSKLMGEKHKVRNFYSNILEPNSPRGDVTADTHAVAGALLRPLSQSATEVAHNFANWPGANLPSARGTAITGIQGTYPLYADAYRAAGAERGLPPRAMQSVTWEAIRGLFPDTFKTPENNATVNAIWENYRRGRITLNDARQQIVDFAGGFRSPDWAR